MNVETLSVVGQLIGAVGVIVSLIYLSRQIAHSAKVNRAEGYERLCSEVSGFAMTISATPTLAALIARVQLDGERRDSFDHTERIQIGYTFFSLLQTTASVFERHEAGLISRTDLDRWMSQNAGLWAAPYLRDVWPILRPNFSAEFAAFAESRYRLRQAEDSASATRGTEIVAAH